jgi:ceramide glucosyltransferase
VRQLIAAHPHVAARLLIGNETISDNPKLNNVCKGWRAAAYDWIVMADSNVLMPRDYIERLLAAWRADTGVVSSPPAGGRPQGFWAELECAFLNTYQLRWQYTSAAIGLGFAQGKSMLYRRSQIEQAGGIRLLAAEAAEDAATTKVVRDLGLRVRLVDAPFEQPLGYRSAGEVWARQLRWAKLRQGLVSAVLCAGDFERQSRPAHGRRLCRRGAGPAFGQRCCARRDLVWRRSRARARSRLASEPQIARRLDAA